MRKDRHVKISSAALRELLPLLWLALGTFATGTESFVIAALLPGLASDLSVSITAAGQLMTVFALTYALSSPLLAAATGGMGRRKVLLASMTEFALANFVAAAAVDYWQLMTARILLACAAGLYVPSASALAGVRRFAAAARHRARHRHRREQHCGGARRAAGRGDRSRDGLAHDVYLRRHSCVARGGGDPGRVAAWSGLRTGRA